jgi:outer membrane protein
MSTWRRHLRCSGLAALTALVTACGATMAQDAQAPTAAAAELPGRLELTPLETARMALERNPDLQAQAEAIQEALARLEQARAGRSLRVNLEGSAMRMGPIRSLTMPEEMDGVSIKLGLEHIEQAAVSFTQPLYTGKRVERAAELAEHGVEAATGGRQVAARALVLGAQEAAYGALRASQLAAVAAARVTAVAEHVKVSQALEQEGLVAEFEVVQAQTELSRAEGDLIAAQTAVAQIEAAIRNIIRAPQTTEISLRDDVPPQEPEGELPELMQVAWEQRPEVALAEAQVRLAEASVRLAGTDLNPTVALTGQYGRQAQASGLSSIQSWQIGLVVQKPLYDGGLKSAKVREAQAQLRAARFRLESVKEQVALQVTQHSLSVAEAKKKIATAQQGLVEARERRRMAQLRYREGITAGIEVIDADTALAAAEANLVNAEYDLQLATVRLRSALGIADAQEVEAQ